MNFKENLATLPEQTEVVRLELVYADGRSEFLENQPGSAGSVRVYAWLATRHGQIDAQAAEEGLRLYAEHTEDARRFLGKHPNIDRLLTIQQGGPGCRVIVHKAT